MSNYGDYGDDGDGFGWDGMGDPLGQTGTWHPAWGALAASGIGTSVSIAIRASGPSTEGTDAEFPNGAWKDDDTRKKYIGRWKYAELWGLLASGAVSGGALFYGPARAAGWCGLAAAFGNHFPRLLEDLLLRYKAGTETEAFKNFRTPFRGTGLPVINRPRIAGRGTGEAQIERVQTLGGAQTGDDRARLLGAAGNARQQAHLVGIGTSSLGGHFGHSIVNGASIR